MMVGLKQDFKTYIDDQVGESVTRSMDSAKFRLQSDEELGDSIVEDPTLRENVHLRSQNSQLQNRLDQMTKS